MAREVRVEVVDPGATAAAVQDDGEEIRQYAAVAAFGADGRVCRVPAATAL